MNVTIEPVVMPPVALTDLPVKAPLRVLILSDLHIPFGPAQKQMLLADRAFLDQHDWVVLLGDMTACYGTPGEYARVREFVEALGLPYSVINGNHEFSFVPVEEHETDGYGKRFEPSDPTLQRAQLRRFESFYRIPGRFQLARHTLADLCLLGVDGIGEGGCALLNEAHEQWLEKALADVKVDPQPLLIFCHYPLADSRLDEIRYYREGTRPYYAPPPHLRQALAERAAPTFWFSGHVHFAPGHPLWEPYQTEQGVWQIHCPDGWGFGRPDDENWRPAHHDDLYVRSLLLERQRLTVRTVDIKRGRVVSEQHFLAGHAAPQPAPAR